MKGLSQGLPFSKYSATILEDKHLQTQVISDELRILIDKINLLREKCHDLASIKKIFEHIKLTSKSEFNGKLEESIGLIKAISTIILFDYAEDPTYLDIKNVPDLPTTLSYNETRTF